MTASELFDLLTPSVDFYFGAYAHFKRILTETLSVADLLPLEWAGDMIARTGPTDDNFQDKTLVDAIMFQNLGSVRRNGARPASHREYWAPAAPTRRTVSRKRP